MKFQIDLAVKMSALAAEKVVTYFDKLIYVSDQLRV